MNTFETGTTQKTGCKPQEIEKGRTKMADRNKENMQVERIEISPAVEWQKARAGIEELRRLLDSEVIHLAQSDEIKNAYSPITWVKLCRAIRHVTEGMTAVRLATEGKPTAVIEAMTGIRPSRIGAFKAWNTRWRKAIKHYLTLQWRKQEERTADIAFLRSIGIAVEDESATNKVAA
jgi:hypothetical protein